MRHQLRLAGIEIDPKLLTIQIKHKTREFLWDKVKFMMRRDMEFKSSVCLAVLSQFKDQLHCMDDYVGFWEKHKKTIKSTINQKRDSVSRSMGDEYKSKYNPRLLLELWQWSALSHSLPFSVFHYCLFCRNVPAKSN